MDELSETKQSAYAEIESYADNFYYTDSDYAQALSIVQNYHSKIEGATTVREVLQYIQQAKDEINAVPKLDPTSNDSTST